MAGSLLSGREILSSLTWRLCSHEISMELRLALQMLHLAMPAAAAHDARVTRQLHHGHLRADDGGPCQQGHHRHLCLQAVLHPAFLHGPGGWPSGAVSDADTSQILNCLRHTRCVCPVASLAPSSRQLKTNAES